MSEKINAFVTLSEKFNSRGYKLYMVGGTVRDYFLDIPLDDIDLVTDATPSQMKLFLDKKCADYTFEKYGSVKYMFNDIKLDITTLRKEKRYKDHRHPTKVKFVKSLKVDVKRRDFSINGLYLDSRLNLYDYINGKKDLELRTLKTIGNPKKRIIEDPLRILRAIRFALDYSLSIDDKLLDAMIKYADRIDLLSKDKIKQEIKKIKNKDNKLLRDYFEKVGIADLLGGR